jgi:hypothetical protein
VVEKLHNAHRSQSDRIGLRPLQRLAATIVAEDAEKLARLVAAVLALLVVVHDHSLMSETNTVALRPTSPTILFPSERAFMYWTLRGDVDDDDDESRKATVLVSDD